MKNVKISHAAGNSYRELSLPGTGTALNLCYFNEFTFGARACNGTVLAQGVP